MTELMPQVYHDLITLCSVDSGFYYKDVSLDSIQYRIFNYRLCSYNTFHSYPSALNCRGIMFNITDPKNIKLVSLPFEKFFNYEEGDGAKKHTLGKLGDQMEKLDGSLISTFLHIDSENQPIVRLKSKTSVTSAQATEAMSILKGDFKKEIENLVHRNYTVNMEYTSPSNRIVIHYAEPSLTVLSIRSHLTGETLYSRRLIEFLQENKYHSILERVVKFRPIPEHLGQQEFVDNIRAETEGEGYVVEIIHQNNPSYLVKVKNKKYLHLHHCKDNVNNPYNLFTAIINEESDDLRTLFVDDPAALKMINDMENEVQPKFNQMVESVENYYQTNKHLSRKDFAILCTNDVSMRKYMSLVMNLYSGKVNDYKKFAILHAKDIFCINANVLLSDVNNEE